MQGLLQCRCNKPTHTGTSCMLLCRGLRHGCSIGGSYEAMLRCRSHRAAQDVPVWCLTRRAAHSSRGCWHLSRQLCLLVLVCTLSKLLLLLLHGWLLLVLTVLLLLLLLQPLCVSCSYITLRACTIRHTPATACWPVLLLVLLQCLQLLLPLQLVALVLLLLLLLHCSSVERHACHAVDQTLLLAAIACVLIVLARACEATLRHIC